MNMSQDPQAIVFLGERRIARGNLSDAVRQIAGQLDAEARSNLLVFDADSSRPIDIDWRGTADEIAARLHAPAVPVEPPPGRGRPRLGVVAREVTLLPRHWEWLAEQPGGASVSLRRLIDQARQQDGGEGLRRRAQESAYRFMTAMAGNAPGFEEALRALYAADSAAFMQYSAAWPDDIRMHARELAQPVFGAGG